MRDFKDLREKTLTPAEKKKREEIAKAMERENPGMDMRKKMAIATWQAKKVAEVTTSPLQKIRMDKEKADRNKDDKDKSQAKRMTDKQYSGYKVKMKEETEELDEISRDLARRYIRKVADKTNTGELSTKQVMKRKPGVTLAGKKAYPGVAGEPKVRATESVEQIDELDKKTLGSYIKKASTNQIGNTAKVLAGKNDPETERARKRMGQRMSGIAKATDKLTKEEAEQIDELKKSTLGSYIKKSAAERGHAGIEAGAGASGSKDQKDAISTMKKRLKGIKMATDRLTKEEVEQIDELSKKTLGSYVKKAKDDLGNREAEVTRNRYVDPRGVKDPVKHNNALLMKRANRRDNINKAVDKLTREQAEDDMAASPDEASMAMRQLDFIEDAAEKIKDRIESGKGFPEWMQNKLSKLHGQMESLYSSLGELEDEDDMEDEMEEEVKSSDKKPEKYTRPDGKVAFRMVATDKKVMKND